MILTGLNPHDTELIFTAPFPANKMELLVHSTTHNASYTHSSHDSILELLRTFPNASDSTNCLRQFRLICAHIFGKVSCDTNMGQGKDGKLIQMISVICCYSLLSTPSGGGI